MDGISATLALCGIATSFIIGLGGLVVAALTSYLSYRERVAPFREKLYTRKIDIYTEIVQTLFNAIGFMVELSTELPNFETKAGIVEAASKAATDVFNMRHKYAAFLPEDLLVKITNLQPLMQEWISLCRSSHPTRNAVDEAEAKLNAAYGEIMQAIRKDVGTEALTKQTLNLITR